MIDYIQSIKQLANHFTQLGKPKSMAKLNRCIITKPNIEWKPLVLALSPSLATMSTDKLFALLLNNEAQHNFTQDHKQQALLSGLLGSAPTSVHCMDGRQSFHSSDDVKLEDVGMDLHQVVAVLMVDVTPITPIILSHTHPCLCRELKEVDGVSPLFSWVKPKDLQGYIPNIQHLQPNY